MKDSQLFEIGDVVSVVWDHGDEPMLCEVVSTDRGFLVMENIHTKDKVIARPSSPFSIKHHPKRAKKKKVRLD